MGERFRIALPNLMGLTYQTYVYVYGIHSRNGTRDANILEFCLVRRLPSATLQGCALTYVRIRRGGWGSDYLAPFAYVPVVFVDGEINETTRAAAAAAAAVGTRVGGVAVVGCCSC